CLTLRNDTYPNGEPVRQSRWRHPRPVFCAIAGLGGFCFNNGNDRDSTRAKGLIERPRRQSLDQAPIAGGCTTGGVSGNGRGSFIVHILTPVCPSRVIYCH